MRDICIVIMLLTFWLAVWLSGSELVSINEVTLRRAWLVLGWVTVSRGSAPGAGKAISVYSQPPMSTQPGHPSMGMRNEYQPKGSDALQLGSKGRYGS